MKLLPCIMLLLADCSARAERKEHSRVRLQSGEEIIQYVEENGVRPYCWLALKTGDEEPVVFWSRTEGDLISWYGHPGAIAGADKAGDDVFVILSCEKSAMYFIQANVKTKHERMTMIPRSNIERAFDLMFGGEFSVRAPNQVHGTHNRTGKTRLLEWREDGKPYLDGEPFYFVSSSSSAAGSPGPLIRWSPPAASAPAPPDAGPAVAPSIPPRGQRSEDDDASSWLWATAVLALLGGALLFWRMKSRS